MSFKALTLSLILVSLNQCRNVGVYFGNWKVYGRKYELCELPGDKIDYLYYSFLDPSSGVCKLSDSWSDLERPFQQGAICSNEKQKWDEKLKGNFYQLQQLKLRFPHLKIFASVGGYTYSKAMHKFFTTDEERNTMAKSCVDMINEYPDIFDGLDIDLEYPCPEGTKNCGDGIIPTDNDKGHFVALMSKFREHLGDKKLLTIASSPNPNIITALDFRLLDPILDWYNIMTYDFTSGSFGDSFTGHHTPATKNPNDPLSNRQYFSTQEAAQFYADQGCSKNKINIGVAFYGRGFKIDENAKQNPFVISKGGLGVGTWEKNNFDYCDLKENYFTENNQFYDTISNAPYIFDQQKQMYISYDNPQSIKKKLEIVEQNEYMGIFSWELTGDTKDYELLNAMNGI